MSLPQKLTTQDNGETSVGSPLSVVPVFGAIVVVVVGVTAAYPSCAYVCVCVQRVCD